MSNSTQTITCSKTGSEVIKQWCEECQDYFPLNEFGEVVCHCDNDPYANDSRKPLDFND